MRNTAPQAQPLSQGRSERPSRHAPPQGLQQTPIHRLFLVCTRQNPQHFGLNLFSQTNPAASTRPPKLALRGAVGGRRAPERECGSREPPTPAPLERWLAPGSPWPAAGAADGEPELCAAAPKADPNPAPSPGAARGGKRRARRKRGSSGLGGGKGAEGMLPRVLRGPVLGAALTGYRPLHDADRLPRDLAHRPPFR